MTRLWCFVGMPCSGKSYTAKMLAAAFGGAHISSGDIARALSTTPELVAETAKADLFPDQDRLQKAIKAKVDDACLRSEHIFLDGFPRYDGQVDFLVKNFWELGPEVIDVNAGDDRTLWTRAKFRARDARDLDSLQFSNRLAMAAQNLSGVHAALRQKLIPIHTIMSSDDRYMKDAFAKIANL